MGLFGGLFGGGTNVSQKVTTTVENNVDVDVENTVDLSGLERVLQLLGVNFQDTVTQLTREQEAVLLVGAAAAGEQNKQLAEANKTLKRFAYGALILGIVFIFSRG